MTFLDFIQKQKQINESSISIKNLDQYIDGIDKILSKHIDDLLVPLVGYVTTKTSKEEFITKQFLVVSPKDKTGQVFQINWNKSSDSVNPHSIDFFNNMDILFNGSSKSKLTINTLDSSLVYFLPIIWTVVNTKNYSLSEKEAIEIGRSIFKKSNIKESRFYVGSLRYHIYENEVDNYKHQKAEELRQALMNRNNSKEDQERFQNISKEFNDILKAIKGGASSVKEIELELSKSKLVTIPKTKSEKTAEAKLQEESEDPEMVFKKMEGYVKMVIKGINPSVILCGAPGVGKTFKVKKLLKSNDYVEGKNLFTIKGKCTPRRLYLALYDYKNKGDILVIDDADSLVGPKAPEDCINILKGALDSTSEPEGRLISYGVAGKITDDDGNELPKRFYYNGSVIIITNYNAGSLDTALRGRSYIQDIHFTTEDVLKIIKGLLPDLNPGKLSIKNKLKAYDYLLELIKSKMDIEVSIRTFIICAMLFESIDDEELAKSMIKEQMKLQADRIKNKY